MWMSLAGYEGVYSDYLTGGNAVGKGGNAPDFAELRDGLFLNAFAGDGPTTEQAFFTVHMLHDIHPTEYPTFHIHWTHNIAIPSGNVKWQIDYSYAKGYENGIFVAPTTLSTVNAAGAQYAHHITADDDMQMTAEMEPDSMIIARIYRDPTDAEDTFGFDAFLVGVDMHYMRVAHGSEDRNSPFDNYIDPT